MNRTILNTLNCAAVVMTLCTAAIAPQALAQNPQPRSRQDSADQLLYRRAFEVALWAMPAADTFAAREAVKRDLHGKPNDVAIDTKPLNSDAHLIAVQTQTPYLQGALDLRDGPIVVEIPAATSESHLYGTICDAWQRPLDGIDVGKDGWDEGKGAKYLLLPPDYKGDVPAGYKTMPSRTYLQNFLIRSISTAGWNAALEYAYTMKVYPLAQAANPGKTTFLDMSGIVYRAAPVFDAGYFNLIDMVVQEEPVNDYDKTMLGMAAYVGIEKGKPFKPDTHTVQILERAAKDAQEYLIQISNGVAWVPVDGQPGWTRLNLHREDIAKGRLYVYENADGMIDYQRRAAIDYWAYVMPADLGSGTMYNVAFVDAKGRPIESTKNYRLRMPKDFPALNFWSVFAYDARTRTFIANSMKGRQLSSLDKLVKNPDGSIDIYIGPTAPKGLESNWIGTIPGIDVFMGLRTYGPEKAVLDGTYKIPRFELMK
ncbi:DUF1214 domain-containing protein [Edaphobacter aggregans]|uniref:DUF1214 domain-containing protein n=1 Tax=Edaphobacter aggregans TaxID=570835 RepID=UPI00054DB1F8|nr:DUF1214 domain-containing protein [Edaphobacter aggregans]